MTVTAMSFRRTVSWFHMISYYFLGDGFYWAWIDDFHDFFKIIGIRLRSKTRWDIMQNPWKENSSLQIFNDIFLSHLFFHWKIIDKPRRFWGTLGAILIPSCLQYNRIDKVGLIFIQLHKWVLCISLNTLINMTHVLSTQ